MACRGFGDSTPDLLGSALHAQAVVGVIQGVATQPVAQGHGGHAAQVRQVHFALALQGRQAAAGAREGELGAQSIGAQALAQAASKVG